MPDEELNIMAFYSIIHSAHRILQGRRNWPALDILKPNLLLDGDYDVNIIFKRNETMLYTFTTRSAGS